MKATGRRPERLSDLIRAEVSQLLIDGIKDPRIGMVNITEVDVSPDIKRAVIYYNIIGDRSGRAETQKGLESAAGFIRTTLARTLTIKRMPELSFAYDTSLDYAEHIEKVIDDLKREQ